MTYQLKAELLAYEYLVGRYREDGNDRMVRQLEATPPTLTVTREHPTRHSHVESLALL